MGEEIIGYTYLNGKVYSIVKKDKDIGLIETDIPEEEICKYGEAIREELSTR